MLEVPEQERIKYFNPHHKNSGLSGCVQCTWLFRGSMKLIYVEAFERYKFEYKHKELRL